MLSYTLRNFEAISHSIKMLRASHHTVIPLIAMFVAGVCSAQVISNVTAANTTNNSTVITWTTDQPTSSLVNYGATTNYGSSSAANSALTTAHSVTLSGLNANTLYNFDVVSAGSGNTTVTSANYRFATLRTTPLIVNIYVTYLASNSAAINWTTDQPATDQVNYGTTTSYGSVSPLSSTPVIAHTVTLNGLTPGTTYNFAVVSSGVANVASISSNQTFTTPAASATAPTVGFGPGAYGVNGLTNSTAVITWTTNVPASAVVAYGLTPALGQFSQVQTAPATSGQITLTGLSEGTKYYFFIECTGVGGATGYSVPSNFTTTGPTSLVPAVTNVTVSNLTKTSATIIWTTDLPSTSQVSYGTTTSYGSSSPLDPTLTTSHSVTLTGLTGGTLYDFAVTSVATTGAATFATNMSGITVWAWGDSLTLGYGDITQNTYPLYLQTLLGVPVNNEGIGGETSTQIAARMLATPAAFSPGNCNVFWPGANNPDDVNTILTDVASMVNALQTPACYLVMGDMNKDYSPLGTGTYNNIISTNTTEAALYGNSYLNIRELLVQDYNPKLPLDLASYASDLPAKSLHAVRQQGTITSGALDSRSCAIGVSSMTNGPGTALIIDSETILINAIPDGTDITSCTRGYNNTSATSHAANSTYSLIDPVHLGSNGYEFVAQQVAAWFSTRFPLSFSTSVQNPVISAVSVSSINSTSAVVSWTTDQPASSLVNYGSKAGSLAASGTNTTLTTTHLVTLTGLTPGTAYSFNVVSADSAGQSSSATATFTTSAAVTPIPVPTISNIAAVNVTATAATISWSTDTPATGQVNYGPTTAYGTESTTAANPATSQVVSLTGLTPNTTYNFQVLAASSYGAESLSTNYTFTTPAVDATPPYVGYVAFWGVNNTGVTLSWSTDVNANTVVAYGTTSALGLIYSNTASGSSATTNHGAVLTGLTPGTKYYFVCQSTGANGATGYSATYTFTTTGSAPSGFSLNASSATAVAGSSGTSTVTVTPASGFNSGVTLAAAGWPTGITGSFGTNPATTSSIVTINVGGGVAPGSYVLPVSGTSGASSASTTISLTVSGAPSFALSATATTVLAGASGTSTIMVTPANGFNSAVTLATSGWPSGIVGSFGVSTGSSSLITISVNASVAPGSYALTVNGTSGALSASTTLSLTVNSPAPQTITFNSIAAQTVGTPLTLNASASSGLGVSYASATTSICTVSGNTATFLAAGTCTITASQAGNASYAAASPVSQSFTVNAALQAQAITFNLIAAQTVGTPLTLNASASSGLIVSYASATTNICTVSGSTATFVAAGTCTITASQAGSATYSAATPVSQSFSVNAALKAQTITFGSIAAQTVGTPLTLNATASSGLAVSYASSTTSICTVSGSTATFVAAGTCTITASQSGNATYSAATPVSQSFSVNGALKAQTITFGSIAAQTVGTPLTLNASASSGLAVSYASSITSICAVSGSTATLVAAGTCTITASQSGNATYSAATPVSQSFSVNAALKAQTITFGSIAGQTVGTPLTLNASASSGLAVSYASSTPSTCTVSGSTAAFAAAGTCTITASQAGNSNYAAATPVSQSFTVQAAATATTVSLGTAANIYGIFNNASSVTNGGFDGASYAYSAKLLGTSLTIQGISYSFGTPGSANAASATTLTLPSGRYTALNFAGAAVFGNQPSQTFTVTYTDGTTSTFTQSMSDWGSPQSYSGETSASTMAYRLTSNGAQQAGPWYVYSYSFALNSAKTVKSFRLPNSRNVVVLAVTLR